jgi:DNA-directed RNA polymerase specialized sigma subunit, sigma24 homolog
MKKSFLTEQELALGCVRNDRDAQGELYARYSSRLYAICLRYIEDREEARDLMHDCMIKAMDNFKSFRYVSEGSVYAWLICTSRLQLVYLFFVTLEHYA